MFGNIVLSEDKPKNLHDIIDNNQPAYTMHTMLLSGAWVLVVIPRVKSESPHVTNGDAFLVALRRKCKDWLDRNSNNVSKVDRLVYSTRGLLFQYAKSNYSCLFSTYRV